MVCVVYMWAGGLIHKVCDGQQGSATHLLIIAVFVQALSVVTVSVPAVPATTSTYGTTQQVAAAPAVSLRGV